MEFAMLMAPIAFLLLIAMIDVICYILLHKTDHKVR